MHAIMGAVILMLILILKLILKYACGNGSPPRLDHIFLQRFERPTSLTTYFCKVLSALRPLIFVALSVFNVKFIIACILSFSGFNVRDDALLRNP